MLVLDVGQLSLSVAQWQSFSLKLANAELNQIGSKMV